MDVVTFLPALSRNDQLFRILGRERAVPAEPEAKDVMGRRFRSVVQDARRFRDRVNRPPSTVSSRG